MRAVGQGSDARCPSAADGRCRRARAWGRKIPGITRAKARVRRRPPVTEHRGESLDSREQAFTRREPVRARPTWAKRTERASARSGARAPGSDIGDRSIPWLCSRGVWVAEVDEQRLVPAASHAARRRAARHRAARHREGRGLAGRLSLRGGSAGEAALKPDRGGESHRAGRLLVIRALGAQAQSAGEGALFDGRRPGSILSSSFDEVAAEADRAAPGDGDPALPELVRENPSWSTVDPGPPWIAGEGVRGFVACSVRG